MVTIDTRRAAAANSSNGTAVTTPVLASSSQYAVGGPIVAWPVTDKRLRQRIINECLIAYLHDDRDAWTLQADGRYARAPHVLDGHGAQPALMARYASKPTEPPHAARAWT